eukprot:60583_1
MSVMISHCKETNRPGMSCYHCDEIGKKSNFILWIFITLFGYELIMIIASVMRDKLSNYQKAHIFDDRVDTTRGTNTRTHAHIFDDCSYGCIYSMDYQPQQFGLSTAAVWTINRSSLDYQPQQYGLSTAAGSGGSGGRGDEYANGGHGRGHQGYGPYRGGSASAMRVRHSPMNGHGNIHVERRNNNQVVGMQEKINGRFRIKIRINGRFKMHIHPMDVGY